MDFLRKRLPCLPLRRNRHVGNGKKRRSSPQIALVFLVMEGLKALPALMQERTFGSMRNGTAAS